MGGGLNIRAGTSERPHATKPKALRIWEDCCQGEKKLHPEVARSAKATGGDKVSEEMRETTCQERRIGRALADEKAST
ncbi:unnamed protein product [Prunus armeniaca]|uniref:Uncharacterized protein n=1 Tax=Prunus armeniaca TaxID=36596 RepID=A0A6J5X5R3_PRUAR|nr:unnamed protein product [Prunus armeniaca]